MDNKLVIGEWEGTLGKGLPVKQLEAVLYAAHDLTVKQIAKKVGINPDSIKGRIDRAKDRLGYIRSMRGLVLEAMKRGIIAPLVVMLIVGSNTTSPRPPRNPIRPPHTATQRTQVMEA